jgi:tRNA-modifying protein YgfZ
MYTFLKERSIYKITGEDRVKFLQGILSNDITKINDKTSLYACMLTPQGKYLADFFLISKGNEIIFDLPSSNSEEIIKKLNIYRLRSRIQISECTDYCAASFIKEPTINQLKSSIIYSDPRSNSLGQRCYINERDINDLKTHFIEKAETYDQIRIDNFIPEGNKDLIPNKSFPFEYELDQLNAIDYNKGCYIGQELVARTHYLGKVRKQIVKALAQDALPPLGTEIFSGEKKIGIICSSINNKGLALVRTEDALQHNNINKITANSLEIKLIFKEKKND